MLFVALLFASASALPILLARRTIYPSAASWRRSEPDRFERGVFVVQFRAAVDAPTLQRLRNVLGYEPTEYVPSNALIIYINSTETGQRLTTALGSRIKHIEKLRTDDRRANIAEAVNNMRSHAATPELRASRKGERPPLRQPELRQVRLRVLSFYASQREHIEDVDRASRYVEQLSNAMSSMSSRPTPRVDDTAHHITIEDVDLDEAELASDLILGGLDDVYSVVVAPPFELLNQWSVPAVHRSTDAERTAPPAATQTDWQPLLDLIGRNQTIGLSDTGIEYNCFFSDGLGTRAGALPTVLGMASVPADTKHTKLRAYSSGVGGDLRDTGSNGGHGTHVAGTIAGRAATGSASAKYNGGAPGARLAFIDLMPSATSTPYLYVPELPTMLQWFFDAGARIKSASWGSNNGGQYTIDERDIDAFTWREREMLVVFAAGNSGTEGSISSPGMNKNGLTVGASMNGYDAYALAADPPRSFAETSPLWLAAFSSRGSAALPFAKPDVVAPGGQYVWSADNDAPLSGSCDDETVTTTGYAGTSMAAPLVSATAALLREGLQTGKIPLSTNAGSLPVRASLVRALLAASGRPLAGIYPAATYASSAVRRNAEGFGRVALDRIVGPSVSLVILSNERAEHGLSRVGASMRACVSIDGVAGNATLDGHELVVQLAYADYPSSVVGAATLVNNLDLIVTPVGATAPLPVNYNAPGVTETRTTLERVVVPIARAVTIEVRLSQLGFGDVQTFSLLAVLRAIVPSANAINRTITATALSAATGAACTRCLDGSLRLGGLCARCGDGVVQSGEQCERGDCCNTTTCQWKLVGSTCSVDLGTCSAQGACTSAGACSIQALGPLDGNCRPIGSSTACTTNVATWLAALRRNATLPYGLHATNSSDLRICCQQFARYAHELTPADPLFHSLASQYIAARLNFATPNVATNATFLTAMRDAKALLESRCGAPGLAFTSNRTRALALIAALTAYNEPPCAVGTPAPTDAWCSATIASADLVCGPAGAGRYVAATASCVCGTTRQQEERCTNLACSGHGASVYDALARVDRCICLPGWAGAACDRCADPTIANSRYLCVGTSATAQRAGSPRYLLRAVASVSVPTRLSGTFYSSLLKKLGKATYARTADALPGNGSLDCACQTNWPSAASFGSHANAAANATETLARSLQWLAVFDDELSMPSSVVRTASAFKTGSSSGAILCVDGLALVLLALIYATQ